MPALLAILLGLLASSFVQAPARAAQAPAVAVDIAPVHGLVARVMQGIGEPTLILPPGASPHGYAMRPSEARALQEADLVVWIGPELTPWLARSIDSMAADARQLELLAYEGTQTLDYRDSALFEKHDHGDEHGHDEAAEHDDDEHGHDEAAEHHGDEHGHDEAAEHHEDEGEHAHDDAHDHHHEGTDPHAWLDPVNGKVWLRAMAEALAELDPANAENYRANAEEGVAELEALSAEIRAKLEPIAGARFIVFHDAYQYFENRFDMQATGAVSLGDSTSPGPARVQAVRDLIQGAGVACVFAEPQFSPQLIDTLVEGTEVKTGTLDPIGAKLTPGEAFYPALLDGLADGLLACLG